MSRYRLNVGGTLTVLSPLHVGTGDGRIVAAVPTPKGANTPAEIAAIQRDARRRAWIPGSTLKGLLRRLAEPSSGAGGWTERLLGHAAGRPDEAARMGALIVRGATLATPADATGFPYADADQTGDGAPATDDALGRGVYIAARTAIDPKLGTAAASKLFFQEVVAPGTTFRLDLLLDLRAPPGDHAAAIEAVLKLLAPLAETDGVTIGAGQADGDGRIALDWGTLTLDAGTLGADGTFSPQRITTPPRPAIASIGGARARWVLDLTCEGPFAILDSSHASTRQEDEAQLSAQRAGHTPLIPHSSLTGVLRSRAAWLAALDAHRANRSGPLDDRDAVYRDETRTPLSPVQRLFGVAGYRALLQLDALHVRSATPWQVHSVRLDRFSGGPIDNALFAIACFAGVRLEVVLTLSQRPGLSDAAARDAEALADRLFEDVEADGLRLGHGTNRGFGWFDVTVRKETHHAPA